MAQSKGSIKRNSSRKDSLTAEDGLCEFDENSLSEFDQNSINIFSSKAFFILIYKTTLGGN